eukprot:1174786-Pleurochrysis_carterae.AAC.1
MAQRAPSRAFRALLRACQASRGSAAFEEPMKEYTRLLVQCKQAIGARARAPRTHDLTEWTDLYIPLTYSADNPPRRTLSFRTHL